MDIGKVTCYLTSNRNENEQSSCNGFQSLPRWEIDRVVGARDCACIEIGLQLLMLLTALTLISSHVNIDDYWF